MRLWSDWIDPVQGERMVQHLIRTVVSIATPGEALSGACWYQPDGGHGSVMLAVDRPASLEGMDEERLLDPGYTADFAAPDTEPCGWLLRRLADRTGPVPAVDARDHLG